MSELNELDVLIAIRDVAVGGLSLDGLDARVGAALSETQPRQRRRSARHIAPLLVGVGVLLPILIAIGAVALLRGPSRSLAPSASAPSANPATTTRQQLLQTLAVLREPPNAASTRTIACVKSPPAPPSPAFRACRTSGIPGLFLLLPRSSPMWAQWGYPRLDPSLIRVVPVPRLHATVTLAAATWQPSSSSRQRDEGLEATIAYSRGSTGTGPRPTGVATVRTHGLAVSGGNATPHMRTVFGAVVVPDGVATVTLKPIRLISPPAPVDPRRFGTVTTSVHDNIAAYRFAVPYVKDRHAKSLVYAVTVVARAIWTDQQGTVIARTTTQLTLWLRVRGKEPITSTN
jgi:hypothetical protein